MKNFKKTALATILALTVGLVSTSVLAKDGGSSSSSHSSASSGNSSSSSHGDDSSGNSSSRGGHGDDSGGRSASSGSGSTSCNRSSEAGEDRGRDGNSTVVHVPEADDVAEHASSTDDPAGQMPGSDDIIPK